MASSPTQISHREADDNITRLLVVTEAIAKEVDKIEQLKVDLAELRARFDNLCADNAKIKSALFGNGREGIDKEVTQLKSQMKVLIWIGGVIGGASLTFLTTFAIYMVVTYGSLLAP